MKHNIQSSNDFTEKSNIYYFKSQTVKRKFDLVHRDLRLIPRANDILKSISIKARALATNYSDMINKSKIGIITVSHKFISGITETGIKQNTNLHKQISELFNIKYHQSVTVNNKKFRNVFTVEYAKDGKNILSNPEQFYKEKATVNAVETTVSEEEKFPLQETKISCAIYSILDNPVEDKNNTKELFLSERKEKDKKEKKDVLAISDEAKSLSTETVVSMEKEKLREALWKHFEKYNLELSKRKEKNDFRKPYNRHDVEDYLKCFEFEYLADKNKVIITQGGYSCLIRDHLKQAFINMYGSNVKFAIADRGELFKEFRQAVIDSGNESIVSKFDKLDSTELEDRKLLLRGGNWAVNQALTAFRDKLDHLAFDLNMTIEFDTNIGNPLSESVRIFRPVPTKVFDFEAIARELARAKRSSEMQKEDSFPTLG